MTPVGWRHGAIVIKLARILGDYIEKRNLGNISTEVGFRLSRNPDTVRAPDLAFVASGRIPAGTLSEKFVEFPPDLAAEVLSPEDTAREILRKVEEYLAAGVALVWVVDPGTQTVTVYRSLQDVKILSANEQLDGAEVIRGLNIRVSEIFAV